MLFDIHGDIWTDVTLRRLRGEKHVVRNRHLARFQAGEMAGGTFMLWIDPPHDQNPRARMLESIRCICAEIWENQDILQVVCSKQDFERAAAQGKLGVVLGIEGLAGIGTELDYLYVLHQMGFRHASLTWNEQNALATGVRGDETRGLTALGRSAVRIMEELKMLVDVAHANDKTVYDVLDICTRPVIASHSNARALCGNARNLTDDQIRAIAQTGGLVGINAFHEFVHTEKEKRTLSTLIGHIDHIAALAGKAHIALGFDFFEYLNEATTGSFIQDTYEGTIGLEDITKAPQLIKALRARGYTEAETKDIAMDNYLRLLE